MSSETKAKISRASNGAPRRRHFNAEHEAEVVMLGTMPDKALYQVACELGLSPSGITRWVKQADIDQGPGGSGPLMTDERCELVKLCRRVHPNGCVAKAPPKQTEVRALIACIGRVSLAEKKLKIECIELLGMHRPDLRVNGVENRLTFAGALQGGRVFGAKCQGTVSKHSRDECSLNPRLSESFNRKVHLANHITHISEPPAGLKSNDWA